MRKTDRAALPHHMQSPVLLAQPMLERVLSSFLGVLLIVFVLFCAFTQYARTEPEIGRAHV